MARVGWPVKPPAGPGALLPHHPYPNAIRDSYTDYICTSGAVDIQVGVVDTGQRRIVIALNFASWEEPF
jgi:hypothetical protein